MRSSNNERNLSYKLEDKVKKTSGDYIYEGTIVGIVCKLNGTIRYVVEDNRGLLFIFNEAQLVLQ